jgi:hypothetical protein
LFASLSQLQNAAARDFPLIAHCRRDTGGAQVAAAPIAKGGDKQELYLREHKEGSAQICADPSCHRYTQKYAQKLVKPTVGPG